MKADNIKLLELIGQRKRTFSIPVYQRNYDWKPQHCKRFFDDVIKTIKSEKEHFLGTIVYIDGKSDAVFREFIVIDGQQRLTTVMLLLKAIHDSEEDESLREEIHEDFLINKKASEKYKLKLKPVESDYKAYVSIIDSNDVEDKCNIISNYSLFMEMISQSSYSPNEIYKALNNLQIVYIQLQRGVENPQSIFESLNSTGLSLTQADLIRNFLLMNHEYDKQVELYKSYWLKIEKILPNSLISDFIRDYLTLKTASIPKKEKVYEDFKLFFDGLKDYSAERILKELLIYAKYYSWFYYQNSKIEIIDKKLAEIRELKSTVTYPFLLNIFKDCFIDSIINIDEVIAVLDTVISYIYRRNVCELPTNALNKVFSKIYKDIGKDFNDKLSYADNVAYNLFKMKSSALYPRNEQFKQSYINRDMYNFRYRKYSLEKIERYNNKEVVDFSNTTIEHIMPQKLTAKWKIELGTNYEKIHEKYLHNIGNLTLSAYNGELSNKPFDEKKVILSNSNISMNRDLSVKESWNDKDIINRSEQMFEKAKNIWRIPKFEDKIDIDPKDYMNEFSITDDVNVKGRKPLELCIVGEVIKVSSWREFFISICERTYEYDAELFNSLKKHSDFKGRNRNIIANSDEGMHRPYKMNAGVYIEVNLSANDVLNYSKLVVEKFDELEEEITFRLR